MDSQDKIDASVSLCMAAQQYVRAVNKLIENLSSLPQQKKALLDRVLNTRKELEKAAIHYSRVN